MFEKAKILGAGVDRISREQAIATISSQVETGKKNALMQVITAYSEFFVAAKSDGDFRRVLAGADLVVPDGVGPLAAMDYVSSVRPEDPALIKFAEGLLTGVRVLLGRVGRPVSGVWLFGELVKLAARNGWRLFLLGGFSDVAFRLANQLRERYPGLKIESDPGKERVDLSYDDRRVIEKINKFRPDVLFVAYGPIKQEKWIAKNKKRLKASVAIGVGGTFDELTGNVSAAPKIFSEIGLKWFWRVLQEPWRWRRILNAFPVFPWLVFMETLRKK